jgi:hypothetical protein
MKVGTSNQELGSIPSHEYYFLRNLKRYTNCKNYLFWIRINDVRWNEKNSREGNSYNNTNNQIDATVTVYYS